MNKNHLCTTTKRSKSVVNPGPSSAENDVDPQQVSPNLSGTGDLVVPDTDDNDDPSASANFSEGPVDTAFEFPVDSPDEEMQPDIVPEALVDDYPKEQDTVVKAPHITTKPPLHPVHIQNATTLTERLYHGSHIQTREAIREYVSLFIDKIFSKAGLTEVLKVAKKQLPIEPILAYKAIQR